VSKLYLSRAWLRRELGFLGVFANAYGDVASTVYFILGVIALHAGGYTLLAVAFGACVMAASALVYAEISSRYPESGGSYLYISDNLGLKLGFLGAWMLMLDQAIMMSYGALTASNYLAYIITGLTSHRVIIALLVLTSIVLLNYVGIRESTRVVIVLVFLDFTIISLLILSGALSLGYAEVEWPREGVNLLLGISYAARGFVGIDVIGQLASEVRSPGKILPRASIATSLSASLMGLTMAYLMCRLVPWNYLQKHFDSPISLLASYTALAPILLPLVTLDAVLIQISAVNAGIVGFSRLLHRISEEGHVPLIFARLHPKFRTPHIAILTSLLISLPLVLPGEIHLVADVYGLSSLITYFLTSIALIRSTRRGELVGAFMLPKAFGMPISALAALSLLAFGIGVIVLTRFLAVALAVVWVAVGLALAFARKHM